MNGVYFQMGAQPGPTHNHGAVNGEIWVANLVGVSRQDAANCTRQLQQRQPISYSWQWNYMQEREPKVNVCINRREGPYR